MYDMYIDSQIEYIIFPTITDYQINRRCTSQFQYSRNNIFEIQNRRPKSLGECLQNIVVGFKYQTHKQILKTIFERIFDHIQTFRAYWLGTHIYCQIGF